MNLLLSKRAIYGILGTIIILAVVLRFYKLGEVPVSLYWDEIADAYNAYSILLTGRDEYGNFLPILFRSFDDYKMPGMVYFMVPAIKIFGLTEFATRFFNAVFGVVMVGATFFLVKEIFQFESFEKLFSKKNREQYITAMALLSAFLLAISPWHLSFSRTGFEGSMGNAVLILGAIFFFKSFRNSKMLFLSACFFAASLYFYRSIFIFLAPFLLALFIIYFRDIFKKIPVRTLIISCVLFILIALPITYSVFTPPGNSRGNEVSIFNNVDRLVDQNQMWAVQSGDGYLGNYFFNKRLVYTREILKNYFSHFSADYLFLYGEANERHTTRNMGVMYVWELPFFLMGIFGSIIYLSRKVKLTLFTWMLIAPIPAAISIFAPHALRSLNMLPIPQIFVALGVVLGYIHLNKYMRMGYAAGITVIMLFFLAGYLFNYYKVSSFLSAEAWGDGYREMNQYVEEHKNGYEKILISGHYWQPYVYTLFYSKYDPSEFQKNGSARSFDKYIFGGTSWVHNGIPELGDDNLIHLAEGKRALVVLSPGEYERQKVNLGVREMIKSIDGTTKFIIAELPAQRE